MYRKDPLLFNINTSATSSVQNPLYRRIETVDGLRWAIDIYQDPLDSQYVFKLDCKGPLPVSGNWLWSCNALCRFDVINNDDTDTCNYSTYISGVLNSANCYSHHKLLNLDRNFIMKGYFEVELRIYTFRLYKYNVQLPATDSSDLEIYVDLRRYYVSKKLLSLHSGYFRRVIAEGNTSVAIKDVTRQNFLAFLLFIYPSDNRINLVNVGDYVRIGKTFDCHAMIVACGEFLASGSVPMSTVERLRLAHATGMPSVLLKIIQELPILDITALQHNAELPSDVKELIQVRAQELGLWLGFQEHRITHAPVVVQLD